MRVRVRARACVYVYVSLPLQVLQRYKRGVGPVVATDLSVTVSVTVVPWRYNPVRDWVLPPCRPCILPIPAWLADHLRVRGV